MEQQLTGNEEFTIKDFWSWAYSDLLDNTQRGVMAEFLVYSSLKGNTPPPSANASKLAPF